MQIVIINGNLQEIIERLSTERSFKCLETISIGIFFTKKLEKQFLENKSNYHTLSMDFITLLTSKNIDETKKFYECLSLEFVSEKHNNGPAHYSHSFKDTLLEIYPETSVKKDKISFIITVKNIEHSLKLLLNHGAKILDDSNINAAYRRATIEDPDGRIIQIIEQNESVVREIAHKDNA